MPYMKVNKIRSCKPEKVIVAADGTGDYNTIQAGLNALPATGGEVFIKEGTYTITVAITIPNSNISIVGSGKATKIVTTSNIIMIFATSKTDLIIRDLYLYGNGVGATQMGIRLISGSRNKVINCWVENMGASGIEFQTASNNNIIEKCWIKTIKIGIWIVASNKDIIINNYLDTTSSTGILLSTSVQESEFKSNIINSAAFSGIQMDSGVRCIITDNIIISSGQHGIFLNTVDYSIIKENICLNNSQAAGAHNGINLSAACDHNTIMENICYDTQGAPTQDYGIDENAGADRNIFVGNIATGNITGQINQTGANSIKADNQEA